MLLILLSSTFNNGVTKIIILYLIFRDPVSILSEVAFLLTYSKRFHCDTFIHMHCPAFFMVSLPTILP